MPILQEKTEEGELQARRDLYDELPGRLVRHANCWPGAFQRLESRAFACPHDTAVVRIQREHRRREYAAAGSPAPRVFYNKALRGELTLCKF